MENKLLLLLVSEMVENAAKSIDFPHSEENVDQIINDLIQNYGIDLNKNLIINAGDVSSICQCILDWQHNTLMNC
ncbi:hypothetical protein D3C87_573790 [compost metagenome]